MKLLIIHTHNANRGDEAAVKAMIDELLVKYPNAEIVISNNGFTPYPNMPENVKQISRFPKLESKLAQVEFFWALATKGKILFTKEAKEFMISLKEADLVIHAPGGPAIGDTYHKAESLYLWRLDFIRKLGKQYMFYAPSMGPFIDKKRNKLRRRILLNAKSVVLRDPISVRYVKELVPEIKVRQALDSALQHDIDVCANEIIFHRYPELQNFMDEHEKCIGITITDLKWHPVHKTEDIIDKIPETFRYFIDKKILEGYGIIFIPQLYGNLNDTNIMEAYMQTQHTFMVDAFSNERDTYFQQYLIGKLFAVVGMRYHSNIFSAKMSVPFVSISYEQKMKGFMEIIGLNDYCIDLYDISGENLYQKFAILEKNHQEYKKKLVDMHNTMKEKAYITTQSVIDILEEK